MSRAAAAMLALGLVAASPAAGWASGLELRIGGFFPRAESDLFDDDAELYTVGKSDWQGVYGGAEYSFNANRHLEVAISLDGYGRTVPTVYRDFERPSG